jgi:hypothetical protein
MKKKIYTDENYMFFHKCFAFFYYFHSFFFENVCVCVWLYLYFYFNFSIHFIAQFFYDPRKNKQEKKIHFDANNTVFIQKLYKIYGRSYVLSLSGAEQPR